jgi:hypothetical protein
LNFTKDKYYHNINNEVDPEVLSINDKDIHRELGMDHTDNDDYFNELVKKLTIECKNLSAPKAIYRIYDDFKIDKKVGLITINNIKFDVKSIIASQLLKSDLLVVFVVTAGERIENYSKNLLTENNYPEGYIVNSIGSAIAESTADFLDDRIETLAKSQNLGISNRFSPGYCNWDVSEQHLLFKLLPDNPCNISINDSALMTPIKSVSGIIGIGENLKRKGYKCNFCSQKDCFMRNNN